MANRGRPAAILRAVSPIHIRAQAEDLAPYVLLPGDPHRARYIAERYLEKPRQYNENRALWGYTGTFEGVPVSVQTTGMGTPSAAIVAEELAMLGVRTMIRVGTPSMASSSATIAAEGVPMPVVCTETGTPSKVPV